MRENNETVSLILIFMKLIVLDERGKLNFCAVKMK